MASAESPLLTSPSKFLRFDAGSNRVVEDTLCLKDSADLLLIFCGALWCEPSRRLAIHLNNLYRVLRDGWAMPIETPAASPVATKGKRGKTAAAKVEEPPPVEAPPVRRFEILYVSTDWDLVQFAEMCRRLPGVAVAPDYPGMDSLRNALCPAGVPNVVVINPSTGDLIADHDTVMAQLSKVLGVCSEENCWSRCSMSPWDIVTSGWNGNPPPLRRPALRATFYSEHVFLVELSVFKRHVHAISRDDYVYYCRSSVVVWLDITHFTS